jgi:hypothetical protein
MASAPCDVPRCVALRVSGSVLCAVHSSARHVQSVSRGARCQKCGKPIRVGHWVTAESVPGAYKHMVCKPTTKE